jgi:glycosyltransferase involved in cell wall biosynthesis
MKKKINKISIITVCLNSEKYIERCLKSVKNQKYPKNKIEHIVIDGVSKDKTLKIIKKFKKFLYFFESKKDNGIYHAMNKGIKKSTGDIIAILNSDDYYYNNTFKIVNDYFNRNNIDFLFGSVLHKRIYHGFYPHKIWYKMNIYPSHSVSFFIKRNSQNKIGLYDQKFKFSADRDLIYRLTKSTMRGTATKKNEVFGKFAIDGISSKLEYFKYTILEEAKIRFKNSQNIIYIVFLSILTMSYKYFRTLIR